MMFRALAIAALTCVPLPALAQDMPLVDHVANMFLGLQAGYRVDQEEALPIQQLAPGVFEVASSRPVKTAITELESCVFNYEATIGTRKPVSFQLDMRKLNGVTYIAREPAANGIATIVVYTDAAPGYIVRDGKPVDAERFVPAFETDIPVTSLEASLAAVKAACPAGDPGEGMELVDHVASVLFGLHDGYSSPVAGRKIPILRTSPGVFDIVDRGMHVDYTLSVSEVGPCLFDVTEESRPLRPLKTRVDATRLTSVSYTPTTTSSGMTTYTIDATLEPGFKIILNPDGTAKPDDDLPQTLETDAPLALLEGSVAALLAACP